MKSDPRPDRAAERCGSSPPSEIDCRRLAELLADYLDGTLPRVQRESIEWHIDTCAACVAFVNTYRSTVNAVRRLRGMPRTLNIGISESMTTAERARSLRGRAFATLAEFTKHARLAEHPGQPPDARAIGRGPLRSRANQATNQADQNNVRAGPRRCPVLSVSCPQAAKHESGRLCLCWGDA